MRCCPSWIPPPALLLACLALATSLPAEAATWRVDRTDDAAAESACDDATPNDCSLRGAVARANAAAEPSTIELPAGTYPLSARVPCTYRSIGHPFPTTESLTSLCLTKETTLLGAGAGVTSIDGQTSTRIAYVSLDGKVEIVGVTLAQGRASGSFARGGALWNDGVLTLSDSVVRANSAEANGGGVFSGGTLAVFRSTFEANLGREGGAVWAEGPSSFVDSRFTDNAAGPGGALFLYRSTLVGSSPVPVSMTGCLVDGNDTVHGAIFSNGADAVLTNTTISGTRLASPTSLGGGLRVDGGTLSLRNVTISDNEGFLYGGGISIQSSTVRMRNSLIAGNRALGGGPSDCLAPFERPLESEGYNLLGDLVGCNVTGDTTGNIVGEPALLGALADNGGPTPTHSPAAGSPALEAGSPLPTGSGGGACAAVDQRGIGRPEGERCDIGALEKPPGLALVGVEPEQGGNAGSVLLRAFGSGFEPGAMLRLERAGESDVLGGPAQVDFGGSALAASFDLVGVAPGAWDVVVSNPDATTATQPAAFSVEAGGGPDLWLELTGRAFVRSLRTSTVVLQLGNRGNVDALGVPISLSFPSDVRVAVHGDVLDPPEQPGQVYEDWSTVPIHVSVPSVPDVLQVPLLLPAIPAGSTRSVRLSVTLTGSVDRVLNAAVGTPYFQPGVYPAAVARLVDAALAIVERTGGLPIPASVLPEVRADLVDYVTAQREAIRADAVDSLSEALGAPPRFYSESRLEIDAAYFAAQRTGELVLEQLGASNDPSPELREGLRLAGQGLERALAVLGPAPARAADRNQKCPTGNQKVEVAAPGTLIKGGCKGDTGPEEIGPRGAPPPPTCFAAVAKILGVDEAPGFRVQEGIRELKECGPSIEQCEALPDHTVALLGGAPFCVPKDPGKCSVKCKPFPLKPVLSVDPNEKVGRLGSGGTHAVSDRSPFTYTVYFENLETATAPAQEVVVTDELDAAKLDLSTFALGPIAFDQTTLTPAPGAQAWSGGADLRPGKNLIVAVDAALDEEAGVVTWRFRSLDPDTLEFTDDPLAGFLAPNVTPPEGDGSVSFTVAPKADLADGTTVCNDASIVFDTNEAIATPAFCNTLDETPPASAVEALPLLSPSEPFLVAWSSTDASAGVAGTSIYVSANGGPYEIFVEAGPGETFAEFTPEPGTLYRFYSVAVDAAGNEEAAPADADAETTTTGAGDHDLAVLSVKVPRRAALATSPSAREAKISVSLQNLGPHAETIATLDALRTLVTLDVDSLGACPDAEPVLQEEKIARKLPLSWAPRKKLRLAYAVRFDCANDAAPGTPDFTVRAHVNHLALGSPDAQPVNDVCPRTMPDGSKWCAAPLGVDVQAR